MAAIANLLFETKKIALVAIFDKTAPHFEPSPLPRGTRRSTGGIEPVPYGTQTKGR
jgi:hypothetical protein